MHFVREFLLRVAFRPGARERCAVLTARTVLSGFVPVDDAGGSGEESASGRREKMDCPHCKSSATTERLEGTELGDRRGRCGTCQQGFNERTGTLFNRLQYPTDVVCVLVLWRFRYKLSLRDLSDMCLDRGMEFPDEAVREWETKLAPTLPQHRRGRIGRSWYCDETYLKVKGRWVYVSRAIDRDG